MQSRLIESDDTEWGCVVRVEVADGEFEYFSGFNRSVAQRRGAVFRALINQFGHLEMYRRGVVPTVVASRGKPWIAAYLFSAQSFGYHSIGKTLDVETGTVYQYVSDVRQGRR